MKNPASQTKTYAKPAYPDDWPEIARATKDNADWTCADCSIHQGEDPHNNITVHHDDHDTFNNLPSNLIVLCQVCHLRHEREYRRYRRISRMLDLGQAFLPGLSPFERELSLGIRNDAPQIEI